MLTLGLLYCLYCWISGSVKGFTHEECDKVQEERKPQFKVHYLFQILKKCGDIVYKLVLPLYLFSIHHVFHVSIFKRYCSDYTHVIQWDSIVLGHDLSFEVKPISVPDRQTRNLRSKNINSIMVNRDIALLRLLLRRQILICNVYTPSFLPLQIFSQRTNLYFSGE